MNHPPRYLAPVTVAELAARLGITPAHLCRTCAERVAAGMPSPVSTVGHRRWDRRRIDAWLAGNGAPTAANDAAPLIPSTDDDWRQRLAAAYGAAR